MKAIDVAGKAVIRIFVEHSRFSAFKKSGFFQSDALISQNHRWVD
jgi:hypothetical protein